MESNEFEILFSVALLEFVTVPPSPPTEPVGKAKSEKYNNLVTLVKTYAKTKCKEQRDLCNFPEAPEPQF